MDALTYMKMSKDTEKSTSEVVLIVIVAHQKKGTQKKRKKKKCALLRLYYLWIITLNSPMVWSEIQKRALLKSYYLYIKRSRDIYIIYLTEKKKSSLLI